VKALVQEVDKKNNPEEAKKRKRMYSGRLSPPHADHYNPAKGIDTMFVQSRAHLRRLLFKSVIQHGTGRSEVCKGALL